MTTEIDNEETIAKVTDRLVEKNPDVARSEIESVVRQEFDGLVGRPVKDYLAVLTERAAKKRLKKIRY
ncbi:MAG: hypothetical protein ABJB03_05420 [Rhodoglobus sp.]